MAAPGLGIFSATYSNVPVYEFSVTPGQHIMRRRADDWINATHILKAAGFDKPARTRILEREVQKGVHEKVQGGYGKYQGTWIPLPDGRGLAQRNNILDTLLPIFDFVPGDFSPPAAPKHATAAASKPKAPRQSMARKLAGQFKKKLEKYDHLVNRADQFTAQKAAQEERAYELSQQANYLGHRTPDEASVMSESIMEDDYYNSQYHNNPKKRKREEEEQQNMINMEHQAWADALLDFFMLADSVDRFPEPPQPPPGINLDNPIDDRGHTALHWAAAMGAIDVVRSLLDSGAKPDRESNSLETPLMRAVMFTNNFDKQSMSKLAKLLLTSVTKSDWFGSTVFHHISATTSSKSKYVPARYYMDTIINCLAETWIPDEITKLLDRVDQNGDTAIHIAARNGARKCVRSLLGRHVSLDIRNQKGETADEMIRELNARRRLHSGPAGLRGRDPSSSPFGPDRPLLNSDASALTTAVSVQPQYRSETANLLLNQIAPVVMAKVRSLALAYESEFAEKEVEANVNEHVVKKRKAEIEALQKLYDEQQAVQRNVDMQLAATGESLEQEAQREEEELQSLEAEAMSLLEFEQRESLARAMAKAGGTPLNRPQQRHPHRHTPMGPPPPTNGSAESELIAKKHLAVKVQQAQAERQKLTRDIVRSMSTAGLGERHAEYKRLIHGALGIGEEQLESMMDEILGQLEEDKRERMVLDEAP